MKNQMHTNLLIRSSLTLALAMASWLPIAASAADKPMNGEHHMMPSETNTKQSMDETMMVQRNQAMKEQHKKIMADMMAQDAELTELVAQMNRAPQDKKLDMMATVVTKMVKQRTAMNVRMSKMQNEMMKRMPKKSSNAYKTKR